MSTDSSKPVPWQPITGVLLVVALYFVASFVGSLAVAPLISLHVLREDSVLAQFLFIVLVEGLTVAGIVWFLKQRKTGLAIIGLNQFRAKYVATGLVAYPVYFVAYLIIIAAVVHLFPGLNVDQKQQLGFDSVHGALALLMTFISLVVLPPFVEELSVRGLLFTSFRSKFRLLPATLLTSAIFAAAHLPEGGASGPLYIAAVDTFTLSLALCWLREKTGSLWPGITLHALKNGIAFVSLYILALH